MLEQVERRGARLADMRAKARRERIAAAALPGITLGIDGEHVVLSAPGLARDHERSAELRWRIAEVCDER